MADEETLIWEGHPSQWTNLPLFLLCVLIVPIPFAIWRWLQTRCFVYRITSERILIRQGVFSKRTDELELYRVKDTALVEPFWLRLVSRGHIDLVTSDRMTPTLRITAVPEAATLREKLRGSVERARAERGVRETDLDEPHHR